MQANHQQRECDEQLLRRYLDDELTEPEQQSVELHLCQCDSCRSVISNSAADADWWGHASTYLRGDAYDAMLETSVFSNSVDLSDKTEDQGNLLNVRQIQQWLDPTDDPRMLGRFGGYEIVGIIGQGGMGIVLKGFEPSLNRYVAIKALAPYLAGSGAARKRFAREAKATAAVLHDNVIPIHRVDEDHDLPFLVMPYVADSPLQQRIDEQGALPLVAILRIGEQIAAGLAAAHSHGLVHRDIKPANVLLENGVERVRITDFGLARAADDGSLTRTGVIAGTPQYMSPEQARGENVDSRSDLFSLGSVMYAMATGHAPFRAETPYGILRRIIETEPRRIRESNPEIPAWLEGIIRKLHARSLADRFTSAAEVAELLRRCLAHVEQPTTVELPAECQCWVTVDQSRKSRGQGDMRKSHAWQWPLIAGTSLALVMALILGREFLPAVMPPMRPETPTVERIPDASPPAQTTRTDYPDDDPATAWDGPAVELSDLLQETDALESQALQSWATLPTDPTIAADLNPNVTSGQESQP